MVMMSSIPSAVVESHGVICSVGLPVFSQKKNTCCQKKDFENIGLREQWRGGKFVESFFVRKWWVVCGQCWKFDQVSGRLPGHV